MLTGLALGGLLLGAACAAEAPVSLAFGDLFVQPIGPRGLEPTPLLRAANGRDVRIAGYMVRREQPQAGRFQLTPRPVTLAEHADGEADDLPASTLTVLLPPQQGDAAVAHQPGPLTLTGRLEYGPAHDEAGRLSWLRLYLAPQALAASPLTHRTQP